MRKKYYSIAALALFAAAFPASAVEEGNTLNAQSMEISAAAQQTRTVTGTVLDKAGAPVIGASIILKGNGTVGTVTDLDGKFSLPGITDGSVLIVSSIGYVEQELVVTGASPFSIVLEEDTQALEEVVIVGYGVQKKVNMTGSIANVKADELTQIPQANLSNSLAGRAPGATIVGNSGLMGASSQIRLRGGFGDPLFVIDGIIRDKEAFDALEPYEIDQMSFLKDAATASIYGSSAGNGVILVTTRTGKKNMKPVFNYQGSYSISETTQELFSRRWNAIDELEYQNAVARFKGQTEPNGEDEFAYFRDNNINYDVNDYIWQNPWNTKHSLSVTGGADKVQYYVMGSFIQEEGSYVTLKSTKFSLRSNLTVDLSKYIKMNVNLAANQSSDRRVYWPWDGEDDYAIYDIYRCTFNALKTTPFYLEKDGTPSKTPTEYPIYPDYGSWQGWNPVDQVIGNRYQKSRRRNFNGILGFDIDLSFITKGLSTKITGNYVAKDFLRKKFVTFQKNYKMQIKDPNNRFVPGPINENEYNTFNFSNNYENLQYQSKQLWSEQFNWFLNYNRTFRKHDVSGMVVFEQASNGGEWVYAKGEDLAANLDQMFVTSEDAERRYGDAVEYTGAHLSWIGRFNYSYDKRYIAEFSFRYDGNTKFPKGKRWGFFPSVSAAWRISEEPFMAATRDVLDNLKLRVSYGTTGNDLNVNNAVIPNFSYTQQYNKTSNEYVFGDGLANTIAAGSTPNTNLTWATSRTYNVGLDVALFGNRLTGTFDAFYRSETGILGSRTVTLPSTFGTSLAPENYAARSWRGGEANITWADDVLGGELNYSVYANMGYAKDQWDVIDESAIYKTGNLKDLSLVGMSSSRIIGLIADHLLTDPAEVEALKAKGFKQFGRDPYLGGILYKDTRGDGYAPGPDGKVDSNDIYNLLTDNSTPRINYGFGGSISWKGISLDVHFQGVGSYMRSVGGVDGGFYQHGGAVRPYFPIWTSDKCYDPDYNPTGTYPRVIGSSWYESGAGNSSFWMRNGSYLRLKNLNIGYSLPKKWLKRSGIDNIKIFANGTNLFVISAVTEFLDPEQKYYDSYPLMKTYSFGLNITF